MHRPLLSLTTFVGGAIAAPQTQEPPALQVAAPSLHAAVLWSQSADGGWWARGATYKAGFGKDGFIYIPFLGADAPRNFPVQFTLRSVGVGGKRIAWDEAPPTVRRDGDRIVIDHGPVDEVYDLAMAAVEQTFVVDGAVPGDVEVEIAVTSELREDPARPGLQFGNELGSVDYGSAFLVAGGHKVGIASAWQDGTLRLHVPAAARTPGPVVIDPIVTTSALAAQTFDSLAPDLAYDVTTNRWLIAWATPFSAIDHDVVAEKRTGGGTAIAGSITALDVSPVSYSLPRVANLNRFDRFLAVMQRIDNRPGGTRYQVWARTVDAAGLAPPGSEFAVSPAFPNNNQWQPDVGGDPGTGEHWFVVWYRDGDIFARLVDANGVPGASEIPIENGLPIAEVPQVSNSNGNGQVAAPRWCVTYMLQAGAGNRDICGATFDLAGNNTGGGALVTGVADDRSPYVSAPLVEGRTLPEFAICYERQGVVPEMQLLVVTAWLGIAVPEVNLSRRFGLGGRSCRVDSDGLRLAVCGEAGAGLAFATLAIVDGGIVLHESPQPTTFAADSPYLVSKRSGGGGTTDYGLVCRRTDVVPTLAGFGLYRGQAVGGFARRLTGCGLTLTTSGVPALGQTARFTLTNAVLDVPFLFVGVPGAATTWCGTCRLGVQSGSVMTTALASALDLRIPSDLQLIGVRLAVQGLGFGSGPCSPSALRFSDTIDVTVQ